MGEEYESLNAETTAKFHYVGIQSVEGLAVPEKYKNTNAQAAIKYSYFLQVHISLFAGRSFIGRTYAGK
jgi:hypothetical protein